MINKLITYNGYPRGTISYLPARAQWAELQILNQDIAKHG
jgi:hypothetical protein